MAGLGHGRRQWGDNAEVGSWIVCGGTARSLTEVVRGTQQLIRCPPATIRQAVDAFDPDRGALVLAHFLNESPDFAGRPVLAWRRPQWIALEDKTVVDQLWDRLGVPRAPSQVVPVEEPALRSAVRSLDRGAGTVWMLVLRAVAGATFFYAGCASVYDPPQGVRHAMVEVARRVGEHLRATVDFRGAFTIDGVVGADGFVPTELNPRMGAGLITLARSAPEVPLQLLLDVLVAGIELDYDPVDLERLLLDAADARRQAGSWRLVATDVRQVSGAPLVEVDRRWTWAEPGDEPAGHLTSGPSPTGGLVRLVADPHDS